MAKREVHVAALGAVRKMLGFSRRTIAFEGGTVGDLLRSLETIEGGNLYLRLVADGKLRPDYAVLINGANLPADQLEKGLEGGEQVVTMAIVRPLAGGKV